MKVRFDWSNLFFNCLYVLFYTMLFSPVLVLYFYFDFSFWVSFFFGGLLSVTIVLPILSGLFNLNNTNDNSNDLALGNELNK